MQSSQSKHYGNTVRQPLKAVEIAWYCRLLEKNQSTGLFVSTSDGPSSIESAEIIGQSVLLVGADSNGIRSFYSLNNIPLVPWSCVAKGRGSVLLINDQQEIVSETQVVV